MGSPMPRDNLLQSITQKSLALFEIWQKKPVLTSGILDQWQQFSTNYINLAHVLYANQSSVQHSQYAYYQDALELWHQPIQDPKFSSVEWTQHPVFNLLSQNYLLLKQHTDDLIEKMEYLDTSSAKKIKFFTRQILDAASPAHFLGTNPEVLHETMCTNGQNLLVGFDRLLTDLAANPDHPTLHMTDPDAFKVGVNLAVTPGKVVYKNDLMELIQYSPQTTHVQSVPLLVIPPWINKYYIMDLSPNNSLIRWLVRQGLTVFVISWVNPAENHAHKGMEDYLNQGPIAAVDFIQKHLLVKQINTVGFCIGGTLLAMLLAYYKSLEVQPVRSATFLASMIDFSDPGDIGVFIDEPQIAKIEEHMQSRGYLEGHWMASAFNSLRANDLIWSFVIRNYLQGKSLAAFDLLFWNMDSTNMPAKMHSEYLRWMYLQNDLVKPGKIVLNQQPLDIHQVDLPVFFVSTKKDHIAPWKTTYAGFQLFSGEKKFLLAGSGHIAGIIIPPGSDKYGYHINDHHYVHPDDWLSNSRHYTGSWWPEWYKWLKQQSGKTIAIPEITGEYTPAPGEYVHIRHVI